MENSNDIHEIEIIDLREYLKILTKWKLMIASITILSILTSAVLSYFVLPPVYKTTAVLMVAQAPDTKRTVTERDDLEGVVNTLSRLPQMTINTYIGQIKAEIVLQRVIDKLRLDKELYKTSSLAKMVEVESVKDSNLIEIGVENTDPRLGTDIANTLAAEVADYISEKNQQQMSKSVEFLQKQILEEEKNLKKATKKLDNFQSEPRSVDTTKQEMGAKVADLNKYQSGLQQLQLEYQQTMAGKMSLEEQLTVIPKTITIKKRLAQDTSLYSVVYGDKASPNTIVTSEEINPDYMRLSQELSIKQVVLSEKKAQIDGMTGIIKTLGDDLKRLQKEVTLKQAKLELLQADVDRLTTTFNLLQEKVTQTQIAKSINLGETSLLVSSPALKPEKPVKPKKLLNIAIAAVLGAFLSVTLAIILEKLDNTFKRPEDIENILGLPVLGNIPLMDQFKD